MATVRFTDNERARVDEFRRMQEERDVLFVKKLKQLKNSVKDNEKVFVVFDKGNAYRDMIEVADDAVYCIYNSQTNSTEYDDILSSNSHTKYLFLGENLRKKTILPEDIEFSVIDTYVQIGSMMFDEISTPRSKKQQLQCSYGIEYTERLKSRELSVDESYLVSLNKQAHNRLRVLLRHNLVPISRYDQGIVECRRMN